MRSKFPQLRVHMPALMIEALERAARRQLSNVSVYTRQALQARLIEDGMLPASDDVDRPKEAQRRSA